MTPVRCTHCEEVYEENDDKVRAIVEEEEGYDWSDLECPDCKEYFYGDDDSDDLMLMGEDESEPFYDPDQGWDG